MGISVSKHLLDVPERGGSEGGRGEGGGPGIAAVPGHGLVSCSSVSSLKQYAIHITEIQIANSLCVYICSPLTIHSDL